MVELKIGDQAPEFELYDSHHRLHRLADFLGRNVVLFFYPKDDAPGCTQEACDFRDFEPDFSALNTVIIGISKDTEASHDKFVKKYSLPYLLLADPDAHVIRAYGVWKDNLLGHLGLGTARTTFVIDTLGYISEIYWDVKAQKHAEHVLVDLRKMLLKPPEDDQACWEKRV